MQAPNDEMSTDALIALARYFQGQINNTLGLLQDRGVHCHSVASYFGAGPDRYSPPPLHRVQLVLEMKQETK